MIAVRDAAVDEYYQSLGREAKETWIIFFD